LVNGKDTSNTAVSPAAINIALTMNTKFQKILAALAKSLFLKYPLSRKK
jgi:hypothetical protein